VLFGLLAYGAGAVIAFVPVIVVARTRMGRAPFVFTIAWAVLAGVPYLFLFGVPWTFFLLNTARCARLPAVATNFAAAYSYALPGDYDYGAGPFDSAYFCTAAEAERAGYHRTPLR
jgi:hypothetical protein